jgi:2-polyprenyl-6-hydroxyphenyl methylase/3-demethylubiquinone-9 3-methyltransferase
VESTRDYYSKKLSAYRLMRCYDIAPPRVKKYLQEEINFVLSYVSSSDTVLELGCGYGRVLPDIASKALKAVGIDKSKDSIELAIELLSNYQNIELYEMEAENLKFADQSFDVVIVIQNGISAFKINKHHLIKEAVRVTCKGGTVLFSSYSEKFWNERLEWFQLQAQEGLLGEIDYDKTQNGTIICKDGFKATTIKPQEFLSLTTDLNLSALIKEVDQSSLFCIITVQ